MKKFMRFRNNLFLPGLLLLLMALRLGIILTSVELISHYDELDLGTIARDLNRGLHVPFWFYQLDAYSGESFILGPMVWPFARIFGQNLFAIKMVPLLFSILTLCAIYGFILRYFGKKAAVYSSLLFVLAPPGLVQLSLAAMTGHTEAFFFGFLALFCFYEFFFKGKKPFFLGLFGLLSGFAVWFYYANAVLIASCLILFLISDRRLFIRSMPLYAGAFLVTFSPWIISNFSNHFMGLELVSENVSKFGLERVGYILKKPFKFFLLEIPLSFATLPVFFIPRKIFAYTYYFFLLTVTLPFAFRQIKNCFKSRRTLNPTAIFWIYQFVYLIVLTATRFDFDRTIGFVGFRYATPFLILVLLGVGVACSLSLKLRPIFWMLLFLGLLGQVSLLFKEPLARAFEYKGYSYYQLGTRWHFNLPKAFHDYEDFRRQTLSFPDQERKFILWGLAQMSIWNGENSLFERHADDESILTVKEMTQKEPIAYWPICYEMLGNSQKYNLSLKIQDLETMVKSFPVSARKYFCQGWLSNFVQAENFLKCPDCYPGKNFCDMLSIERASIYSDDLDHMDLKRIATFGPGERKRAYRGLGYSLFLFNAVVNPLFKTPTDPDTRWISSEDMPDVYWGIGWGIREKFREDKTRMRDWILRLPVAAQDPARTGAEAYDQWYAIV